MSSLFYNVNGPRYSDDTDFWAEFDLARYGWVDVDAADTRLPEQFVANFLIKAGQLVEIKIVIKDKKPQCRALKIMVRDDQPAISAAQLRLPLDKYINHACQAIVIMESSKAEWQSDQYANESEQTITKIRQRRPMTDALLRRVAETYNSTGRGKIAAVMDAEYVANSTARLYVSEARKRGFLPSTTRGKATS
jgi:hypothetical protein